jgi:hypothetical protein
LLGKFTEERTKHPVNVCVKLVNNHAFGIVTLAIALHPENVDVRLTPEEDTVVGSVIFVNL